LALLDDKRSKDFSVIRKQYELLHQFYEKYLSHLSPDEKTKANMEENYVASQHIT